MPLLDDISTFPEIRQLKLKAPKKPQVTRVHLHGDEFFCPAFGKNTVKMLWPYSDFRAPDTNWESHSSQGATG